VLETKPFSLSNSSHFFYSIQYGTTDSLSAIAVLGESGAVNFTVELVDDQTNSIIGSYDNITFNSFTSTQYDNIAYQVNTEGIGTRMVRLRLVVNHSGLQPTYGITDRHAVESVLGKKEKQVQKILFNGTIKIDSYTLDQNYPNPFNPTTAINYTLPNPGNVLLKVYDALGKEVVTLVNSHQESGRYSVEFDASNLSSGIYLYKLTSGSYTEVKKMMLLK
ncbi:MAG: T9SS type A sorting domain-containing protein, partial [Bacteroidetes bacterium]|nr:T9SS type A sorting domain-containing protein [Bacteroidota bacterium]